MIVDAHVHILPDRVRDNPGAIRAIEPWFAACHRGAAAMASAESLVATMDAQGVDRAVCLGWPFVDPALCAEANDYVAAAQRRFPTRLVGFGVIQPGDAGAAAEVLRCARSGLRGIGEVNADAQGWNLLDGDVAAAVDASVATDLPWTLHCSEPVGHQYPGKGMATPDRVAAFAERHPALTLVCAHLGGGLPLFAHMPEVAALCRRLYFDTAAQPYLYEPSVYGAVLDGIGAGRVLLGSDHPLLDVPRYLRALEDGGVSAGDRALICGANAQSLLRL